MAKPTRGCRMPAGCKFTTGRRSRNNHIPPNYVVEDAHRSAKASRGADLEVQEPVVCRDASAFHFHPTLARVLGPTLIRDKVVQMREPCEKRLLAPFRMVASLHGEECP